MHLIIKVKCIIRLYICLDNFQKTLQEFWERKGNTSLLQRKVKHFEDCEQLIFSVGKCFVIKALMEFFQMDDAKCEPTANGPHSVNIFNEAHPKTYIKGILDKFLDNFFFVAGNRKVADGVWCYGCQHHQVFHGACRF